MQTPQQVAHHPEAHKLVEGVGVTPFGDALKMRFQRLGRGTTSTNLPLEPPNAKAIAASIERYETRKALRRSSSREVARTKARPDVLRLLRELRELDFKPDVREIVAATLYDTGLHGGENSALLSIVKEMHAANTAAKGAIFKGGLYGLNDIVRQNLFLRIHDLLHDSPRSLAPKQVMETLGLESGKGIRGLVSNALGVMDLMGLTYKLPNKGREFLWISACYKERPETIPTWNMDYNILKRLYNEGKPLPLKISDLSKEAVLPRGGSAGVPDNEAIARSGNILTSFRRLEKAGVIATVKNRTARIATLTDYGKKLLAEQSKLNYLHPELREVLLGTPRPKGEPSMEALDLHKRLLRWGKVKLALREAGYRKVTRLLDENIHYVNGVSNGSKPHVFVPPQRILAEQVPLMMKKDPRVAMLLSQEAWKQLVHRQLPRKIISE